MAICILAMLAMGKFMVSLDESDPLRFNLTQWHKVVGVLLLLLAVARLLWRLTHKAPAHPANAPTWEKHAANVSHLLLYFLILAAPITGWMMVSVSPLNIDTVLYRSISWPHIPYLSSLPNKGDLSPLFHSFHQNVTEAMIAVLLLHIAGAIKHKLIDKDEVMGRIWPQRERNEGRRIVGAALLGSVLLATGLVVAAKLNSTSIPLQAGNSKVSFIADVAGDDVLVIFADTTVDSQIDLNNLEQSVLSATVNTTQLTSDNFQVTGSLSEAEWFDSANFPEATFAASSMEQSPTSPETLLVSGLLTIKDVGQTHTFDLKLTTSDDGSQLASGSFEVDRLSYSLGEESQPNDDWVAIPVQVHFEFELTPGQK